MLPLIGELSAKQTEKMCIRDRFSPYCSVASLYLWAAAGGAVPGLKDYAPAQKPKRKG